MQLSLWMFVALGYGTLKHVTMRRIILLIVLTFFVKYFIRKFILRYLREKKSSMIVYNNDIIRHI